MPTAKVRIHLEYHKTGSGSYRVKRVTNDLAIKAGQMLTQLDVEALVADVTKRGGNVTITEAPKR
jgi:hypothetical protein